MRETSKRGREGTEKETEREEREKDSVLIVRNRKTKPKRNQKPSDTPVFYWWSERKSLKTEMRRSSTAGVNTTFSRERRNAAMCVWYYENVKEESESVSRHTHTYCLSLSLYSSAEMQQTREDKAAPLG